MSKERLEEIKEHFTYCIDNGLSIGEQEEKLLYELYKQAERAQELEGKVLSLELFVNDFMELFESVQDLKRSAEYLLESESE